jgi:hypothetical protein
MSLGTIIINWNNAPDTIVCAKSLLSWTERVWIVDNASEDDSVAQIKTACPKAILVESDTNRGFAGGNNLALADALDSGCDYVLLLNNDAEITAINLIYLLETLTSAADIAVVGPLLRSNDLTGGRLLSAGGQDVVTHLDSHITDLDPQHPIHQVDYVPGTVALARIEAFRKVGLFDEDYFFSIEMADWCARARRQGYRCLVDTGCHATHNLERSATHRQTLHLYYIVRNRFLFIQKHKRGGHLTTFWTLYALALAGKMELAGQTAQARIVRMALADGLKGVGGNRNEQILHLAGG